MDKSKTYLHFHCLHLPPHSFRPLSCKGTRKTLGNRNMTYKYLKSSQLRNNAIRHLHASVIHLQAPWSWHSYSIVKYHSFAVSFSQMHWFNSIFWNSIFASNATPITKTYRCMKLAYKREDKILHSIHKTVYSIL